MTLWHAEWTRLVRNHACVASVCGVLFLLLMCAIDGGLRARDYREHVQSRQTQWAERLDTLRGDAAIVDVAAPSPAVATAVFEFGRTHAPTATRPALGGLALSARHFAAVPADVNVTLESRYVDSRRTETIDNPLIASLGAPDFSVMVALLMPLLVIGLTHGLVQEARELGIWRFIRAQTSQPWKAFGCALILRWLLVAAIVATASGVALVLDPGATMAAGWIWVLGVSACALLWTALAGLSNLLPISSAASTLLLLGIWLLSSFASPGLLTSYARAGERSHSQLETLHTIRNIQQDAELRERELLERWYREHPQHVPASIAQHTFPVTFVPRYIEQDRRIVPMMRTFEELRSLRAKRIEPLLALAPGPGLVLLADHLAGSSAEQQHAYMGAIAELEQRWRDVLYPAVMSYGGLKPNEVDTLASLSIQSPREAHRQGIAWSFAIGAAVLIIVLIACRKRLLFA